MKRIAILFRSIFLLLLLCQTALFAQSTKVLPTISNAAKAKNEPIDLQTMHLRYLVVDSAIKVGDSSINMVYSTNMDPYNYIFSTDGPLLINGRQNTAIQNTFLNSYGGGIGIGYSPTNYPAGSKLAVNGNTHFAGYNGINTIPNFSTRLGVVANTNEIGLQIDHRQNTASGIAIKDVVNHPLTKAFNIVYQDNNPQTIDPETFTILGNGITNISGIGGGYQTVSQLFVETNLDVACKVRNTNPGKIAFLAEIPRNDSKAISVVNFANAGNPKEVFKVTGAGIVWMQEAHVRLSPFPDYVFDEGYNLMDLGSLEKYILENHKLPGMPTAKDVEENDADLGELVRIQQEKIEELTLHLIEMKKRMDLMESQLR